MRDFSSSLQVHRYLAKRWNMEISHDQVWYWMKEGLIPCRRIVKPLGHEKYVYYTTSSLVDEAVLRGQIPPKQDPWRQCNKVAVELMKEFELERA